MSPGKITFCIYAAPTSLSVNLVNRVVSHGCNVVFPHANQAWKSVLSPSVVPSVKFVSANFPLNEACDYIVVFSPLGEFSKRDFSSALSVVHTKLQGSPATKSLIVLPFTATNDEATKNFHEVIEKTQSEQRIKIVFVGDIYDKAMDLRFSSPLSNLLQSALYTGKYEVFNQESQVVVIDLLEALEQIMRVLFSYWYPSPPSVIGHKTTYGHLLKEIQSVIPNLLVETKQIPEPFYSVNIQNFLRLKTQSLHDFRQVVSFLLEKIPPKPVAVVVPPPPVVEPKPTSVPPPAPQREIAAPPTRQPKKFTARKILLTGLFLAAIVPFVSLALATLAVFVSVKTHSLKLAQVGRHASWISAASFEFCAEVPVIAIVCTPLYRTSDVVKDMADIALSANKVLISSSTLFVGITSDEAYDIAQVSDSIKIELDGIYQKFSFLEGKLTQVPFLERFLPDKTVRAKYRSYLASAAGLVGRLPELIDGEKQKSYLVMFQNNMELRPTGGFIGSFGLVTFEGGKLIDTAVFDVYAADGQLKGHVEPPSAIKNYLGEANWYLRDSNWDPDFKVSAERAEWFLEKELSRGVDGVIAVDLDVAVSMLSSLGPITLNDFNVVVDSKNLYEKVQHEVEANFFPGSQKKTNFLTSLSRELISRLTRMSKKEVVEIASGLEKNLIGKHIQVVLHDQSAQEVISSLGWDGGVVIPDCNRKCTPVWAGVAEANVGVNKANYYIKRSIETQVNLSESKVEYLLSVTLQNSASDNLSLAGRYKAYLRALGLPGSSFDEVEIREEGKFRKVTPEVNGQKDRVEAGVVVDIPAGQSREVVFKWSVPASLDFTNPGQANFAFRKQAGTGGDQLQIKVFAPVGTSLYGSKPASLTQGNAILYNTTLEADYAVQLNW